MIGSIPQTLISLSNFLEIQVGRGSRICCEESHLYPKVVPKAHLGSHRRPELQFDEILEHKVRLWESDWDWDDEGLRRIHWKFDFRR